MTGRERLLTAINHGKPDRLPCLIHCWVGYHLQNTMGGDCGLAEAKRRMGDKRFLIGGFDQNAGFERGNPN